MSFEAYCAIVHGAASQAPPTFFVSNGLARGDHGLASTHAFHSRLSPAPSSGGSSGEPECRAVRHVRVSIPTPNAATNVLDVPHLLPAVVRHQKQSLLPHRIDAPLVQLATSASAAAAARARCDGSGLTVAQREVLNKARQQARVAQAYQHALTSTSCTTTAALLAFGGATGSTRPRVPLTSATPVDRIGTTRHPTAVSPSSSPHGAFQGRTPVPGRASLLPSGQAPLQRRRYPPSASPSDRHSRGARGVGEEEEASPCSAWRNVALRIPQWSASPVSAERTAGRKTAEADEDGGHGSGYHTTAARTPTVRADVDDAVDSECRRQPPQMSSAVVTRSPSSLRFSTPPSRAWSPPSSSYVCERGQRVAASGGRRARQFWDDHAEEVLSVEKRGHEALESFVEGTPVNLSAVQVDITAALPTCQRVDTTQPFLNLHHVATTSTATGAILTQPPSPTQVTVSLEDWSAALPENDGHGHLRAEAMACVIPLSRCRGGPCDDGQASWIVGEDKVCVENQGEEVMEPMTPDRQENDVDDAASSWRTPRASAQRPRPSTQLLIAAAEATHQRGRHRRLSASPTQAPPHRPSAKRGDEDANGDAAYWPSPSSVALVTERHESAGRHYHIGRSRSVAAETTAPTSPRRDPAHRTDVDSAEDGLRQRILAKQRALEAMLAETEDSLERSKHVEGTTPRQRTMEAAPAEPHVGVGARSASWVLRSLSSRSSPSLAGRDLAVTAEAASWRPTVNHTPSALTGRHPRRAQQSVPSVWERGFLLESPVGMALDTDPRLSPLPFAEEDELHTDGGSARSEHLHNHGHRLRLSRRDPHVRSATCSIEPSLSTIVRDSDPRGSSALGTLLDNVTAATEAAIGTMMSPTDVDREEAHHTVEGAEEAAMEPVGMDEAGNILYRRVSLPQPTPQRHHTAGSEMSTYCPMDRVFAEHGLTMPFSPPRTAAVDDSPTADANDAVVIVVTDCHTSEPPLATVEAGSPVARAADDLPSGFTRHLWSPDAITTSSLRRSPLSLLQALVRADVPRSNTLPNNNARTDEPDDEDDFTIRRSTVHDVLTHILAGHDGDGASARPRAPLGGASLRFQLPVSMRDASPAEGGEEEGRASSFLHVRPSTREALAVTTTTADTTACREGSASFLHNNVHHDDDTATAFAAALGHGDAADAPPHARTRAPHDPHPSQHRDPHRDSSSSSDGGRPRASESDFLQRGSLARSVIESASSRSRGSLLSSASFDYYARRLAGSGGSSAEGANGEGGGTASPSAGAGRRSWAPHKVRPRLSAAHDGRDSNTARLSNSTATVLSTNFAVEALRYSSSSVDGATSPVAVDAFAGSINELAEGLRAHGERQHERQPHQRQEGPPVTRTVSAPRITPGLPSRSPSLRAPSGSPRGVLTGSPLLRLSSSSSRARSVAEPLTSLGLPNLGSGLSTSPVAVPVPQRVRRAHSGSSTSSPPVVTFYLPAEKRETEEAMNARCASSTTAMSVSPWIDRLLRVQQRLQRRQCGAANATEGEGDVDTVRAAEKRVCDEDEEEAQRHAQQAARAFEYICAARAQLVRTSPDADVAANRAHSLASAVSWWSDATGRDAHSQSVPMASTPTSRAHSLHSPASTGSSSLVAGRRAILLDASLTSSSPEHDVLASFVPVKVTAGNDEVAAQHSTVPQSTSRTTAMRLSLEQYLCGALTAYELKENEAPRVSSLPLAVGMATGTHARTPSVDERACAPVATANPLVPSTRGSGLQGGRLPLNPHL